MNRETAGDVGEAGHAEADCVAGLGAPVDLGELVAGPGKADLESLCLPGPALAFGLGDAGDQVVADLCDAVPLAGRRPVHTAAKATVLVNAGGAERAAAGAGGDLAELEMTEELGPFLVAGDTVFPG